jgi:hypothetical protein
MIKMCLYTFCLHLAIIMAYEAPNPILSAMISLKHKRDHDDEIVKD